MKFFKDLFDDNNSINEKAVVGFIAFFMLVIALGVDLLTGYFGNPLVINEFIFDGFMVIILGAFGIASVDKWMNKNNNNNTPNE
jgi:membrane-anchored glycerophosphoryl diester phosphodiesterase (GDPDase)